MSTDILFSTVPSVWTQVEGLYVNQQRSEGGVTGANVNTGGLFDVTLRGPLTPQVVSSPGDFQSLYGGRDAGGGGSIVNKIWKAMLNRKFAWPMVIQRVCAAAAVAATDNAPNGSATDIISITAANPGTWANGATGYGITYDITAASDANANHFNLVIHYLGETKIYKNLNTYGASDDNTTDVIGTSVYNLVKVAKLANGRPANATGVALASGTDGTVAVADYEAAFDKIAAHPLVRILPIGCDVVIDGTAHATMNGYVATNASNYPLTHFLEWSGADHTRADEITAKSSQLSTPVEGIMWCYNMSATLDSTGSPVETGPHLDAAVILCNNDVAIHLGDEANLSLLSHVKYVKQDSLNRADLVLLRAAGITTLEHVSGGFQFKSAVRSNSTGAIGDETSVEDVDVRRRAWIIESLANAIRHDVKKAGTDTRRRSIIKKASRFCADDQKAEHVVASDNDVLGPGFKFFWAETPQEAARNIAKLGTKIRMISYLLTIVMVTDISTGTTIVKVEK